MMKRFWIITVGILAVFSAILYGMGRLLWCSCGLHVWTWSASSSETSQNIGDPYSFSHLLHGIIFFGVLTLIFRKKSWEWKFIAAMLIEIAWELLENSPFIIERYRAATVSLDYYGDSILNSLGDVGFCMVGFSIASMLPWKWTVGLIIAIELIMLVTIRDNLTLNIIMLVRPVTAIRDWQLAH